MLTNHEFFNNEIHFIIYKIKRFIPSRFRIRILAKIICGYTNYLNRPYPLMKLYSFHSLT